jgi:hypothetical protein
MFGVAYLIALVAALFVAAPASADGPTSMRIGAGFVDVIPHQIVRAADDRVYVFAAQGQYSGTLQATWTSAQGLPNDSSSFDGVAQVHDSANIISVAAAYDGGTTIHVLDNTAAGELHDHVFDLTTQAFTFDAVLARGLPTVSGDYLGTSGIAAMMDSNRVLHVAFWSAGSHVSYAAYTYDPRAASVAAIEGPTILDSAGSANHPALAVAPTDNTVSVAWVSEATRPARVLARTRTAPSTWTGEELVSSSPVWTSTNAGVNIDQGPSLVIATDGTRQLAYIEDYNGNVDYGHVHVATGVPGQPWIDQGLDNTYTHDPALGLDASGTLYLLGHGHPGTDNCRVATRLCLKRRNADGSWEPAQLLATPDGNANFDASVSVKWSAVGFQRPETLEFAYFSADAGNYNTTSLYYGRLSASAQTVHVVRPE